MAQMRAAVKAAGIPCYLPDVKPGPCKAPYAVIYDGGTAPIPGTRGRLGRQIIRVMILAPASDSAALGNTIRAVLDALNALTGLHHSGELTPIDTDQERAAVYQTTDYTIQYATFGG